MNGDESAKLDEIHDDVRETRTNVEVIDERTQNLDSRLQDIRESVRDNREDINEVEAQVSRNKTILGGLGAAATAVMLWAADKIGRFL